MKCRFFFFAAALFLPFIVFAVSEKEFTIIQDFTSLSGVDADYTSAWFDPLGKRVLLARDYSTQEVSSFFLDSFICDAEALKLEFALAKLTSNTGCKVTPNGFILFGFFKDGATKNWVGQIYTIQGSSQRLISQDALFTDKRLGEFFIGVKNASELFIIYNGTSPAFFEFTSDIWVKQTNDELKKLRLSRKEKIAWSGNAWFFSRGGQDLSYFDGTLAVGVFGQVPNINFSLTHLETDLRGDSMIVSNGKAAWRIHDNGYKGSLVLESQLSRSKSKDEIIKSTITPNATVSSHTSLQYFISANNGKRWHEALPNQTISISEPGKDLKFQAVLASREVNETPILKNIRIHYETKDVSSRNAQSRDNKRIKDIKTAERFIVDYYDDIRHDPILENALPVKRRWELLKATLVDEIKSQRRPKTDSARIERNFPLQPVEKEDEFLYDYRTDSFGKSFVLYTKLESPDNSELKKDLDGFVINVNCNDPFYCVGKGPGTFNEEVSNPRDSLIKLANDYRVYWIRGNTKRWITNPEVFRKHGFRWEHVHIVPQEKFTAYELASPLRS